MTNLVHVLVTFCLGLWATNATEQLLVENNFTQIGGGQLEITNGTGKINEANFTEVLTEKKIIMPCYKKRCGGGGGGPCNRNCWSDSFCSSPCPYCKRLTVSNWKCRPNTCSMACTSSSQCKGSCPVCFAAKCQQCQADSHCVSVFGSAKPYCKRITAINRECRADTCSMACLSSSECKGSCPVCFAAKCQQCQSDSHCRATFGSAKPYCKRITAINRECRADTCSMACLSSSECKGSCPVCFAAKCQQCQSDSHCRATFGSAKPYCKRITATNRECRADTCSMFCRNRSECKGSCGRCCFFKCKSSCGGCFPAESMVMMKGGEKKSMEDLRIGDSIMTVENGKMVPTRVLGFLDKKINQTTNYLNLILEDNRSLYISPSHVMFVIGEDNIIQSTLAKDVSLGDVVIVEDDKEIGFSQIKDITMEQKMGAYVPLTDIGTLLVDGVLVSSYTNTDHWLAHIALAPLRWWPTLLLDTEKSQDMEGLRTFPRLVRELGSILGLVTTAEGKIVTENNPLFRLPQLAMEKMDKTEF